MTNLEYIKNMDAKEMANWLMYKLCTKCVYNLDNCIDDMINHKETKCEEGVKKWLESEAEE